MYICLCNAYNEKFIESELKEGKTTKQIFKDCVQCGKCLKTVRVMEKQIKEIK